MNLDLISMGAISVSSYIVIVTMARLLGKDTRQRIAIGIALGCWFAVVTAIGATGLIAGGGPIRTGGLGLVVVLPIVVLCGMTFLSEQQMTRIRDTEILPLISVQALRILGIIFVLLYAANRLPAPFAPLAGYGDMSTGILAVPLAWAVASRKTPPQLPIYLWSALGIGDLINALALGVLSAPSPFQVFKAGPSSAIMPMLPWLLIPGFLVPAFLFLHLVVLAQLRHRTLAAQPRLATS